MSKVTLMVGTGKGAFILRSDESRDEWETEGPHFKGNPVEYVVADGRDGSAMYASVTSGWHGPEVHRSTDGGTTWEAVATPRFPNQPDPPAPGEPKPEGRSVERVWTIEPAGPAGTLYAGVDPGSLFVSRDNAGSWEEVLGINEHPTRPRWQPGFGGMCLHTVIVDPANPNRIFIAISAAGVFYSEDGGKTFEPRNNGIRAEFMPEKEPELGQCVHKLVMHPKRPDVLFLQNHGGVYRTENGGLSWEPIEEGLPAVFGFPIAVHPHDPETLYIIPLQADVARLPVEGDLAVYRSRNSGKSWEKLEKGLPEKAYVNVLRQALATDTLDPAGIYFGTRTGQLFGSHDNGDTWSLIADFLPPILSVRAAVN